jgi:hypothetical protein
MFCNIMGPLLVFSNKLRLKIYRDRQGQKNDQSCVYEGFSKGNEAVDRKT